MKKILKLVLLLLTAWPVVYIYVFAQAAFDLLLERGFDYRLFTVHAATIILVICLLVFYVVDLYRNRVVLGNSKLTWLIGFILLSSFVMLVYWWKFVWNNGQKKTLSGP